MNNLVKYIKFHPPRIVYLFSSSTTKPQNVFQRLCSSNATQFPAVVKYDVHNYKIPLTMTENKVILETINTATAEELVLYNLPKSVAKKLVMSRKKKKFVDVKELLFVEGIGLKRIEGLCMKILTIDDGNESLSPKKGNLRQKAYHIPKLTEIQLQTTTSVVGVHLKHQSVSWCELQRTTDTVDTLPSQHSWDLTQLRCRQIVNAKQDTLQLCNQAIAIASDIPRSDVYVLPERVVMPGDVTGDRLLAAMATAHLWGALTVALRHRLERESNSGPPVVCYAKENQATRAITLKSAGRVVFGATAALHLLEGTAPPLPRIRIPTTHLSHTCQPPGRPEQDSAVLEQLQQHCDAAAPTVLSQHSLAAALFMALTFTQLN